MHSKVILLLVIVFALFNINFMTGCGGSSDEPKDAAVKVDWQDKLEEKIKFEMPDYLSLESVDVTDTFEQSAGDYSMTEFKFTVTLTSRVDLYEDRLERDYQNKVRKASLVVPKGERVKLDGKGRHGSHVFTVNLPYKAFEKLGVERAELVSKLDGDTLLVKDSAEEIAFYEAVESEKEQAQAQLVAQREAQEAQREENLKVKQAEVQAYEQARLDEKKQAEQAKLAFFQGVLERFMETYKSDGVVHLIRNNKDQIISITNLEKVEGEYENEWKAVVSDPAYVGRSLCRIQLFMKTDRGEKVYLNIVPESVLWGAGVGLNSGIQLVWNSEEERFEDYYSRSRLDYTITLNSDVQVQAKASLAQLLAPWGEAQVQAGQHAIVDGFIVDLHSGVRLAKVGKGALAPSDLAAGAFVDSDGRHFYAPAYEGSNSAREITIAAEVVVPVVSGKRQDGYRMFFANTKYRIYEKGGDIFVSNVADDFAEYRQLTNYGVFGNTHNNSFAAGDYLYLFSSTPMVRINLVSGELVEVAELPDSPAFLKQAPMILGRYSLVKVDELIFVYDYATGQELRLDANVGRGGVHLVERSFHKYDGKLLTKELKRFGDNIFYFYRDRAVIDFSSMSAYSLVETTRGVIPETLTSQPNKYGSGLNFEKLSPSGRYALFKAIDKKNFDPKQGGIRYYLVDITDGSVVNTLSEKISHFLQSGSRFEWLSDQRLMLYMTQGSLSEIGLWSLDLFAGKAHNVHTRVKDIRSLAYLSELDRLYVLSANENNRGLVTIDLQNQEETVYPKVEGRSSVYVIQTAMPAQRSLTIVGKPLLAKGLATTEETFDADYKKRGQYHPDIAQLVFNHKEFNSMIQQPSDGFDYVRAVDAVIDYLFGSRALARNANIYHKLVAKTPDLEAYLTAGKSMDQIRAFHREAYQEVLKSVNLKKSLPLYLDRNLSGDSLQSTRKLVQATLNQPEQGLQYPEHRSAYQWVTNWQMGGFDKMLAYDPDRLNAIYLSEGKKRYHAKATPKVEGEEGDFAPYYARKMTSALLNDSWWPSDKPASRKAVDGDYYLNAYRRQIVADWNDFGVSQAASAPQSFVGSSGSSTSTGQNASDQLSDTVEDTVSGQSTINVIEKKVKDVENTVDAAKKAMKDFGGFFK